MDRNHDDFDDLRKLLALKRYEQPPPGYFERFPQLVIQRLRAAQSAAPESWWARCLERLLGPFEARPALAGAFGFAVCAFLATGFLYSEPPAINPILANSPSFEAPYELSYVASHASSTNGALRQEMHRTSFLDGMRQDFPTRVQLVNWR